VTCHLLSSPKYAFEERAAIHEHYGGLPRDEAERLAWEHVGRQWALLDALGGRHGKSRGATEHWRPPEPDWDALAK
jgi:hypothetical protein